MSQRRDRYPKYAKVALCQACCHALRLTPSLEEKASQLMQAILKRFLSLHIRFEPDMVVYSRCEYSGFSESSMKAIDAARGEKKPWTGELAMIWRKREKCPLTPNETALVLRSLHIATSTNIYLATGDDVMEIEGFTSVCNNVFTKSNLLSGEDFVNMNGNTKASLHYYVSINSDAHMATYFGNMDRMVAWMRTLKGSHKTLFFSRRALAEFTFKGFKGEESPLGSSFCNGSRLCSP